VEREVSYHFVTLLEREVEMTTGFLERLKNTGDVLTHYAPLHTLLVDWGKDLESHLSEWVVNHPKEYQEALSRSFEAGCDLAYTATQASSPWRAEVFGLRDRVYEFNYKSAKLAKEVTPKGCYLMGLASTTNPDFLQPLGNMTPQEVYEGYKLQISALLEGGVDIILVAGNHIEEGVIAIQVVKDLAPIPVIAQNIFYWGKKGFRTMMGLDPGEASARLAEAGADVIGGSCGLMKKADETIGYYQRATLLVKEMRQGCPQPLSIQPDAGLAQLIEGKTVYPATPDEMASEVTHWIKEGARVVGGCCGTSLKHYEKISAVVRKLRSHGH
jgi:5-methyltetrahydrofolate--homocysteine methyltransferase